MFGNFTLKPYYNRPYSNMTINCHRSKQLSGKLRGNLLVIPSVHKSLHEYYLATLVPEKPQLPEDPLQRTGRPFGGLLKEIRNRLFHYKSDFSDAASKKCVASIFFIFFACCAPAVTFGGLLSKKTEGILSMKGTLIATSAGGVIFGVFSAQPMMMVGATGPMLIFEESLFSFCKAQTLDFLVVRFWVGIWAFGITFVVVGFEGSYLIRFVTRFSEEIISALVSVIFIAECWKFLLNIYRDHPVASLEEYLRYHGWNSTIKNRSGSKPMALAQKSSEAFLPFGYNNYGEDAMKKMLPNTALLSTILLFGTFIIAWLMRRFRHSKYFGRGIRRTLGDFGLTTSIVVMSLFDYFVLHDVGYTQKLKITNGSSLSDYERSPFVNPFANSHLNATSDATRQLMHWVPLAAFLPGLLLFLILFVEVEVSQMQLAKKEFLLVKGTGYHWDMLLSGFLVLLSSFFGLPWLCAATVRSMAHLSSLTKLSTTHAPGQKPSIVGVVEQRVTTIVIHILIGLCLFASSVLSHIPLAVLLGVFLYFGVMNMLDLHMLDRAVLFIVPVKYHPCVSYCLRVKTWRMHVYTAIQLACFVVVWVIKSVALTSFAFPFAIMLTVLLRHYVLPLLFTEMELKALDAETTEAHVSDERDFYQAARLPV